MRILISWLGHKDLKAAAQGASRSEVGPVCRLLQNQRFDYIHLFNDMDDTYCTRENLPPLTQYLHWLTHQPRVDAGVGPQVHSFTNIGNSYSDAIQLTARECANIQEQHGSQHEYHFLLSPGTPAMQVALVLVKRNFSQARFWATWYSRALGGGSGIEEVNWPYDINVDSSLAASEMSHLAFSPELPLRTGDDPNPDLIGESRAFRESLWLARRIAPCNGSVLIQGETGTGKEAFAELIHKTSEREGEYHKINCAGFSESLLDSEMFGYVEGAFTGAERDKPGHFDAADGGTLFLDEIGEMPIALQAKLLRVLQKGEFLPVGGLKHKVVDVRVVAATNRDLRGLIREGKFRQDLFYRLSTFIVRVPPLRERGQDVVAIARHLLGMQKKGAGQPRQIDATGERELKRHSWPGNVRELEQVTARLRVLLPDDVTTVAAEHIRFERDKTASYLPDCPVNEMSLGEFLTRLAGDLDELIRRFDSGNGELCRVPGLDARNADGLLDGYLRPLLLGRAYWGVDCNGLRAGPRIGQIKLERNRGDWYRRYATLSQLLPLAERLHEDPGSVQNDPPAAGPRDAVAANVESPSPDKPG